MTVISGRTDAPEVRCDLTDRHTHRPNYSNPPAHACQGLRRERNPPHAPTHTQEDDTGQWPALGTGDEDILRIYVCFMGQRFRGHDVEVYRIWGALQAGVTLIILWIPEVNMLNIWQNKAYIIVSSHHTCSSSCVHVNWMLLCSVPCCHREKRLHIKPYTSTHQYLSFEFDKVDWLIHPLQMIALGKKEH